MYKNMASWKASGKNSFGQYVNIGEIVDEDIVDYFNEVLPPFRAKNILQCGEPMDTDAKGQKTYLTFEKIDGNWTYTGEKINCQFSQEEDRLF